MSSTAQGIRLSDTRYGSAISAAGRSIRRVDFGLARYRAIVVVIVLLALELLVFRSYFVGRIAPPWDFFGPYNTEAYQWWELGGFFAPREWVANAWAGYPSALNLQNSAWYLPVGLASAFGPFTLHASAVVAALHVAFGALGTYLLVRSFQVRFPIAVLALVAAFFAVGYYSNAQHVDISRAYAWIPWLLLVFAPTFPWRRAWSIPVASLVIWQAVTGMYPGVTIALIYTGAFWVVMHQILTRYPVRRFLGPLAISVLIAICLSMPRLLPYAMLQEDAAGRLQESSSFSPALLGTLVFGYSSDQIGNDVSMRSLFVPSTILVLAFFACWRHRITKLAIAMLVPAIVLGMPGFPWAEAVQNLPGLGFSRFGLSDFKVFMVLGVVLLACSGATAFFENRTRVRMPLKMWISLGGAWLFALAVGLLGKVGPYSNDERIPGFILLLLALASISVVFVLRISRRPRSVSVVLMVMTVMTAVTGTVWAFQNELPWRTDRVQGEISTFGETVDALISQRSTSGETTQRAPRVPLPADTASTGTTNGYSNRYSYLNRDSIVSYINLKGSVTQSLLNDSLLGPNASPEFAAFLAAPGTAVTIAPGSTASAAELSACVVDRSCGAASVAPVSYTPGHLAYEFSSPGKLDAIFNEAFYEGWTATACTDGACKPLAVTRSAQGLVSVEIPAGTYLLHLNYVVRGTSTGWALFWGGVVSAMAVMAGALLRRRGPRVAGTAAAAAEVVSA